MATLSQAKVGHRRKSSVVSIEDVKMACHPTPKFGKAMDRSWKASNVTDICTSFYLNPFSSHHMYNYLLYWHHVD